MLCVKVAFPSYQNKEPSVLEYRALIWACKCRCCCWLTLYSAILRSRADSLRSHVILLEWLAFYAAFLNIHPSGVLTLLTWPVPHETAAVAARSVYTIQPCTMSLHANVTSAWCLWAQYCDTGAERVNVQKKILRHFVNNRTSNNPLVSAVVSMQDFQVSRFCSQQTLPWCWWHERNGPPSQKE